LNCRIACLACIGWASELMLRGSKT
jgi:hypothetical protein